MRGAVVSLALAWPTTLVAQQVGIPPEDVYANLFWEADPVAQMRYEYDRAVEQLKEGRGGLEAQVVGQGQQAFGWGADDLLPAAGR